MKESIGVSSCEIDYVTFEEDTSLGGGDGVVRFLKVKPFDTKGPESAHGSFEIGVSTVRHVGNVSECQGRLGV